MNLISFKTRLWKEIPGKPGPTVCGEGHGKGRKATPSSSASSFLLSNVGEHQGDLAFLNDLA